MDKAQLLLKYLQWAWESKAYVCLKKKNGVTGDFRNSSAQS